VYVNHDCFVYPGIWDEPLGRVYLEALATGTPMVTTDYGNISSIVGPGGVTTEGTVEDFVDTLLRVVRENRLPELSTGATSQAERYRLDRVIDDIECVYNSL
jgi:glycosyltransferase involved in cell wall biosynthesis